MRCQLGYHINHRTGEVHRPGCSHHAEVNCRPLPASVSSLYAAVVYARVRIDSKADPCGHCLKNYRLPRRFSP